MKRKKKKSHIVEYLLTCLHIVHAFIVMFMSSYKTSCVRFKDVDGDDDDDDDDGDQKICCLCQTRWLQKRVTKCRAFHKGNSTKWFFAQLRGAKC